MVRGEGTSHFFVGGWARVSLVVWLSSLERAPKVQEGARGEPDLQSLQNARVSTVQMNCV